jgi:hypothetical protein
MFHAITTSNSASGNVLVELVKGRALVPALTAADAVIFVNGYDLPAALVRHSLKL